MNDFDMIVRHFPSNDNIIVFLISDVHLGAKECREQEFIQFINSIASMPNAYLILGGDIINNATRSSVSNVFEELYRPMEQKKMAAKILAPVAHKILCAVPGNHERRSGKDADDDPTYDVLAKLDREDVYRPNMAFLKIQMGKINQSGDRNPTYTIVVTHGAGGGMLTSGSVLRGERMGYAVDGADCFVFGHHHRPFITQPGKIFIDTRNEKVSIKPLKVIGMTSWIDYGGYAMQKMLLPTSHCLHTLTLCGNHKEIIVTM